MAVAEMLEEEAGLPCRLFRPSVEAVRCSGDKRRLGEHLDRIGLPTPAASAEPTLVPLPAVVKPCREGGGKGVFFVRTPEERDLAARKCRALCGDC